MAISLGMDPASSLPEIGKEYLKRTNSEPIAPVPIDRKDAPCKENILMGKDVDLCKLPVPLVHDGDGGRYVGTWHAVVTKHPVRGDVNWGMYRQMMFDGAHHVGRGVSLLRSRQGSFPSTTCRAAKPRPSPPPSASRRWRRWPPALPRRSPSRNWSACCRASRRGW